MSTPQEHINAQRQIWTWFTHDVLPRKRWPRHMISATELEHVYADAQKWRDHEERRIAEIRENIQCQ